MAFELAPLPYAYDALEPTIDKETMTLHHDKHHAAYVAKLNEAVGEDSSLAGKSLDDLIAGVGPNSAPKLRNNGGGHWNHDFFWKTMAPGGAKAPSGKLAEAINEAFGSVDALREQFNAAGVNQFGSGWVWLIVKDGKLAITSTPNQDNPLMPVAATQGTPILGNDVWEHAYYITYRNVRPDYLKAWWNVVNWDVVAERFEKAA